MRLPALILLLSLAGCTRKDLPVPPPPKMAGPAFVDLEPGWRVNVVTPILKSGGFLLKTADQKEEGNTITLKVVDEFLGYETAIYAFNTKRKIELVEVALNRDNRVTHPAKSFAPRLRVPSRLHFVRLLFTLKVSDADHNMAVLAAVDRPRLDALTRRVQASPSTACRNSRNEYCEWIPAGVAVRHERPGSPARIASR